MAKCFLCKSNERDDIKYGEFMTRKEISVHYYCLLLTSNLLQRGNDNQDFLGFLLTDIKAEARRVAPAICCYCKKENANISCCYSRCRKTFHMTCGVKNDAENQFVDTFKSYCNRHVSGKKNRPPSKNDTCSICYENIMGESGKFNCVTMLQAPCCKNGWFHKWCLAAFASSAGYFFKCPLCNDNKTFRQRLVYKGIFIPDRDAAWELEPNAFAELLERPKECSATVCNAKGGRTAATGRNKLIFCSTCGSVGIHLKCMTAETGNFYCKECTEFSETVNNSSIVNISASQQTDSDEEEDIDVCEPDDDDAPALDISHIQDSDEDEGIVQPLGRLKKNGQRMFDDMSTGDEGDDNKSDIVLEKQNRKRANRLCSSDFHSLDGSADGNRDRVGSRDAESLFDSGAESDRSGSSGDKFNTNNPTDVSPSNCNATVEPEYMANKVVVKVRRFTSLNDRPNENWCAAKCTRRRSMGCVTDFNSAKTKTEHNKSDPENQKSAVFTNVSKSRTIKTEKIKEESVGSNNTQTQAKLGSCTQNEAISRADKLSDSRLKYGDDTSKESCVAHRTRCRSLCQTNESYNLTTKYNFRPRTNSEDPSKFSPAVKRFPTGSARRSSNYTPTRRVFSKAGSSEVLIYKRRRSNSVTDYEPRSNKKCRNSTTGENENTFNSIDAVQKKCPSRGRSPLSSNLCDLYAFITPAYVVNHERLKEDTPSAAEVHLPTRPTAPEIGKLFGKNKSNISQPNNKEKDKSAIKTDSKKRPASNNNPSRSPRDIFLRSYSTLIETPTKPRSLRHRRKRICHNFSDQNLSSNQTKIESFFKRL